MSNIRTVMMFPGGSIVSVLKGERKDFPSYSDLITYLTNNDEIPQQLGTANTLPTSDDINKLFDFDETLYSQGLVAAANQNADNEGSERPDIVHTGETSPGVIETISDALDDYLPTSLAGMNPVILGGLALGALMMFKKKRG